MSLKVYILPTLRLTFLSRRVEYCGVSNVETVDPVLSGHPLLSGQ